MILLFLTFLTLSFYFIFFFLYLLYYQYVYNFQYRNKYSNLLMQNTNHRIWNQQDFLELYQEQPKIQTTPTFSTIQVLLESQSLSNAGIVDVKIPTTVSEQVYRFLIYKAIYFHFLDSKQGNPLFKTAQIVFFEGQKDFREWYDIWLGLKPVKKGTLFKSVVYSSSQNITRYYPLAQIQNNHLFKSLLARSKKDGKYYEIVNFDHRIVENSEINILHQGYVSLKHPFLSCLCEYHFSQTNSYFVFAHNPHKLIQLIKSKLINWNLGRIYFLEILLALIYLEQQNFLSWNLDINMIQIGEDGHIVISHNVISLVPLIESRENSANKKWEVLQNLMGHLLESSNTQILQNQETYTDFKEKLRKLCFQKRFSLKDVLNHEWVQRSKINHILSKSREISVCSMHIHTESKGYHGLKSQEVAKIEGRFKLECESKKYYCEYYKISEQTANENILKKYFEDSVQGQGWSLESSRSQKSRKAKRRRLFLQAIQKNEVSLVGESKKKNLGIIQQITPSLIKRRKYKF